MDQQRQVMPVDGGEDSLSDDSGKSLEEPLFDSDMEFSEEENDAAGREEKGSEEGQVMGDGEGRLEEIHQRQWAMGRQSRLRQTHIRHREVEVQSGCEGSHGQNL